MAVEQVLHRIHAVLVDADVGISAYLAEIGNPATPAGMPTLSFDSFGATNVFIVDRPEKGLATFPHAILFEVSTDVERIMGSGTTPRSNDTHTIGLVIRHAHTDLTTLHRMLMRMANAARHAIGHYDFGAATDNTGIPYDAWISGIEHGDPEPWEGASGEVASVVLTIVAKERVKLVAP